MKPLTFSKIRNNPKTSKYLKDVRTFDHWLQATKTRHMRYRYVDYSGDTVEFGTAFGDYMHRFHPRRKAAVVARHLQLGKAIDEMGLPCCMITVTTGQDGKWAQEHGIPMSIEDAFYSLKGGVNKSRADEYEKGDPQNKHLGAVAKLLRHIKRLPGYYGYLVVYEPHTRHNVGYPHAHILVVGINPTQDEIHHLKTLWSMKYKMGSYEHGIDIAYHPAGEIQSMANYLLKYIAKGYNGLGSQFGDDEWSAAEWVFYSLAHKHGWRLYQVSQSLNRLMVYQRPDGDDPRRLERDYLAVDMIVDDDPDIPVRPVWESPLARRLPDYRSEYFGIEDYTGDNDPDVRRLLDSACRSGTGVVT